MSVKSKISKNNYLKGKQLLDEAAICVHRGLLLSMFPNDIHGCIESFQHAFELSLKADYQIHGLSYPKCHNASISIEKITKRMKELPYKVDFSKWDKFVKWISEKSDYMDNLHHFTIYGDEERDIPASRLFTQEEKGEIIQNIGAMYSFVRYRMFLVGTDLGLLTKDEENEFKESTPWTTQVGFDQIILELTKRIKLIQGE
jgi:hypothetical protein